MTRVRSGGSRIRALILSLGMLAAAVCLIPTPSHAMPIPAEGNYEFTFRLTGTFT